MIPTELNYYRQLYLDAWAKREQPEDLNAQERLIVTVLQAHPEYHGLFSNSKATLDAPSEEGLDNPFMHLGLHIAVLEQLQLDSPPGILSCYQKLSEHYADPHRAEHHLMQCLAECIAQCLSEQRPLDTTLYLRKVKQALE